MSMRFRKSVSFGKAVRINFTRTGASLGLGPRGTSLSVTRSGVYRNIGLPGTGVSFRDKVELSFNTKSGGKASSGKVAQVSQKPLSPERQRAQSIIAAHASDGVSIRLSEAGAVDFFFLDTGEMITDTDVIKELKRLPETKEGLASLRSQQKRRWDEIESETIATASGFIDLYKKAPKVWPRQNVEKMLANLEPETYVRRQYPISQPTVVEIEAELQRIAEDQSSGLFKKRKAKEFIESARAAFISQKLSEWAEQKKAFDEMENENETSLNEQYAREYEETKASLEDSLKNDDELIIKRVEDWLMSIDLALEMDASIGCKDCTVYIDLDLPEIEDLPSTTTKRLKSGEVKVVDKTQKQLREEYAQCVLGLAIFIAANVFDVSYVVNEVQISGYTQRRNNKGDVEDDYIYSVKFLRDGMIGKTVGDPVAFFNGFENRMKLTTGFSFGIIEPYTVEDS